MAKVFEPVGIIGRENPAEIAARTSPAFETIRRSPEDDTCTFLTMSGPYGDDLHQSCVIPLIERGLVDCITVGGVDLQRDARYVVPAAQAERFFCTLMLQREFQKRVTSPELFWLFGRAIAGLEDTRRVKMPSLLATAYRHGVPIFAAGIQASPLFLNLVKLKALYGKDFKLEIDFADDVVEMAALQRHCVVGLKKKMAIWTLGNKETTNDGPRNPTVHGHLLLNRAFGIPTLGFEFQVEVADTAFPWLTYALLADPRVHKRYRKLYNARNAARASLQNEIAKRQKKLIATVKKK